MTHLFKKRLLALALIYSGAADAGTVTDTDPQAGGIGYSHTVTLAGNDTASLSNHVGAWSWQDNHEGNPVGWTHTSRWVALTLEKATILTLTLSRDAEVPWPNEEFPDRKADTTSMFPSFTLWRGWDNEGSSSHSYTNNGDVSWAEDISYVDHAENATEETVTRTWVLPAGQYTLALGSFAPATNTNRQGFKADFTTALQAGLDLVENAGIGYQHTIVASPGDTGTLSNHVGAWSWEDASLFDAEEGEAPVGWTHTSRWVAVHIAEPTLFKVTMARDANVPWPSDEEPERKADTSAMFPSLSLYRGWDNDGTDFHTYNGRGNVDWAEDITYHDHIENGSESTITRTWALPAGDYTFALGSKAASTNPSRQGFSFSYEAGPLLRADPVTGGIGYAWTTLVKPGSSGSFSDHVGAWSWEDNALFAPGEPPVGWTHTSRWLALKLTDETFFSITLERDANVPWPSSEDPDRKADTSSMFPSLTLYRGWDNTGGELHTYNNRGNVIWAEGIRYVDHVDNSTQTSITRTWRLPAGEYSLALGSNAPANNTLRQGFKATYAAQEADEDGHVIAGDVAPGGIGYAHIVTVGQGDAGSFSNHVGAWSWEDNALFDAGEDPVGWTHTSRWLALHVKESLTLNITMAQNANVPDPTEEEPGRMADITSMFPSFTLWSGWDNDGTDSHSYNNRGNVSWAEDISYLDHFNNSSQTSITRSYTLAPGYYTLALGSNAPATNPRRQGFSFAWTTSMPQRQVPVIKQHPRGLAVVEGKAASFSVSAAGPDLVYQWMKDGTPIGGAWEPRLKLESVTPDQAGVYTVEVRNAAGWVTSAEAMLEVVSIPEVEPFDIPTLVIGQPFSQVVSAHGATNISVKGLPKGLKFDRKTATISGHPQTLGENFTVTIVAGNKAGNSTPFSDSFSVVAVPAGLAGSFSGPLGRVSSLNAWLGGRVQLQVTAQGSLTGQLTLGAVTHRFTSPLDTSLAMPEVTVEIPRRGLPAVRVTLVMDGATRSVSGQVSDGTSVLPFVARQAREAGAYAGSYTMGLRLESPETGNQALPQGTSVGAFQITAAGGTQGVVLMADGEKFTFASALENHGYVTMHGLVHKKTGSVLGLLSIEPPSGEGVDAATPGNLAVSEVSWYKAPAPKAKSYVNGYGPLDLEVFGRKYTSPDTGSLPLNAKPGPGNARLTFADGGVDSPETRLDVPSLELGGKGAKMEEINPAGVKLTLKPDKGGKFIPGATATFKGSFKLTDEDPVKGGRQLRRTGQFQGMIVDDGLGPQGHGYFLLPELIPAAGASKSTLLSGSILLEAIQVLE
jgi:hypothetical protein